MTKTTLEILREARELITPQERHTTFAFARDEKGEVLSVWDHRAACWCVQGSIMRVAGHDKLSANGKVRFHAHRLLNAAVVDIGQWRETTAAGVNDVHGHAAVLKVMDRAIELAERETA